MIDGREDFKQRNKQNNSHTLQNFHRACEIKESFHMRCEFSHTLRTKFAHPAKLANPCEINSHTLRNQFAHPNQFCTLYETQRGM